MNNVDVSVELDKAIRLARHLEIQLFGHASPMDDSMEEKDHLLAYYWMANTIKNTLAKMNTKLHLDGITYPFTDKF